MTPLGEGDIPPPGWLANRVRPRCLSSRASDRARVPDRTDMVISDDDSYAYMLVCVKWRRDYNEKKECRHENGHV